MTLPLATTEMEFSPVGVATDNLRMFKVSANIGAENALEKASNLLEVVLLSIEDAAMNEVKLEGHRAWATHHAAESAKAIIDSLWSTLQYAGGDQ